MRTALCISGNLRTYRSNTDPINTIFKLFGDIDIFVHTWDVMGKRFAGTRDNIVFDPLTREDDPVTPELIREFYGGDSVIAVEVEHQHESYFTQIGDIKKPQEVLDYENGFRHPDNPVAILPMAYSMHACNKLVQEYPIKYDWVIRFRPDVTFPNFQTFPKLERDVLHYYPFYKPERVSDRVAIASPEIMDIYCSFFTHLNEYLPLTAQPAHGAEWLMRYHLDTMGVKYRRLA